MHYYNKFKDEIAVKTRDRIVNAKIEINNDARNARGNARTQLADKIGPGLAKQVSKRSTLLARRRVDLLKVLI